jgi:hypothetical protein
MRTFEKCLQVLKSPVKWVRRQLEVVVSGAEALRHRG